MSALGPKRTWKLNEEGNALILIRIQKVSTGEIKEKHDHLLFPDWDNEIPSWYIWEEGNFSCDCNRAIFFGDEDETCGETRYRVQLINKHDGEIFYSEFIPSTLPADTISGSLDSTESHPADMDSTEYDD